ncbi:AAA family ATPase [Candidatus Halobeggiatoa sp. HSG11]|nr:AAA family ATPase [Candidatus Halobeggiatoa sp. HSG11]
MVINNMPIVKPKVILYIFLFLVMLTIGLTLPLFDVQTGNRISTVVGDGGPGYKGDGIYIKIPKAVKIRRPRGITTDVEGNIYFADFENNRVRKIDKRKNITTTVAGGGSKPISCKKSEPMKAIEVILSEPVSVAVDNNKNLYILVNTACVYKVTEKGDIVPFIGGEKPGSASNNIPALGAKINALYGGISIDVESQNMYLADRNNHCIRKININANPTITIVAGICRNSGEDEDVKEGDALQVKLYQPESVALDKDGNMYIADTSNLVIRKVDKDTNIMTTIAGKKGVKKHGGDNGKAINATFAHPNNLVATNTGELYIVDQDENRIRYIDQNNIITTIAGSKKQGYSGDGGNAIKASLNGPEDIALIIDNEDGNKNGFVIGLYISEKRNHIIRKVEFGTIPIPYTNWVSIIGLSALFVIVFYYFYLYFYFYPVVRDLMNELVNKPSKLLILPLDKLAETKRSLQYINCLDSVLSSNDIPSETWLDKAINFVEMSNIERVELLAERLNAEIQPTENSNVFKLVFDNSFPLRLTNYFIYFLPKHLLAEEVIKQLKDISKQLRQSEGEVNVKAIILISLEPKQRLNLPIKIKEDKNLLVIPNAKELSELLLSPKAIDFFMYLLANQLEFSTISPYKTGGSIEKDYIFFGRKQIVTQILSCEPKNYLIVGGRQVGKSSLLKKIQRNYEDNSDVNCCYISLKDTSDLLIKLNLTLNLDINTPLHILLDLLTKNKQKYLFLIDEADDFFKDEIEKDYQTLNKIRNITEEGYCNFIFAGFWRLYEAVALDYQSPLLNFGETIFVNALETEACYKLITEPMKLLGVSYINERLIKKIIIDTGQRANLIAIASDNMLKKLSSKKRKLNYKDVDKALNCWDIRTSLNERWRRLIKDEQATRLDRIIIYATVKQGQFNKKDIINILNDNQYAYTAEQLNQSLGRLELAYILKYEKGIYYYCVPLFREMLLEEGVIDELLELELKS